MATGAREQKSYRVQFRFWLDLARHSESTLADYCSEMKHRRRFSRTIRDALRLIVDLRDHRLDVLFELFPWIEDWIDEYVRNNGGGSGDPELKGKIDRIEQLLLTQSTGGGLLMNARETVNTLPAGDDPAIVITKAKVDPAAALNNFISSVDALCQPVYAGSGAPKKMNVPQF